MIRPIRYAYTLLEVIIAISIVGVLVGLIIPAVQNVRNSAARASCLNKMKQIGLALHDFHDSHGAFPPFRRRKGVSNHANDLLGWMPAILPQLGHEPLYRASVNACRMEIDVLRNPPHSGFGAVIDTFVCPADSRLHRALDSDVAKERRTHPISESEGDGILTPNEVILEYLGHRQKAN